MSLRTRPIWIAHSRSPKSRFAPRTKPQDWKRVIRGGTEFEVCETPPRVRFVRDGVHLEIYGEGENLEQLLAIALSLEQVHLRATPPEGAFVDAGDGARTHDLQLGNQDSYGWVPNSFSAH